METMISNRKKIGEKMKKRLPTWIKTEYLFVSGYVIFTIFVIVALSYLLINLESLLSLLLVYGKKTFSIFSPIFIGIFFAWLLEPFVAWLENKLCHFVKKPFGYSEKSRLLAVIITFLIVLFLFVGLLLLAVYSMSKQIQGDGIDSMYRVVTSYLQSFVESLQEMDKKLSKLHLGDEIFMEHFEKLRKEMVQSVNHNIQIKVANSINHIWSIGIKLSIGIILSFYFLVQKNMFLIYGTMIGKILLKKSVYERLKKWYHEGDCIFSGYIRGQTADVFFMIVAISLVLTVVGIRYGILIGCIAGICNYIPYAGSFVAYTGTVLFGLMNGQEKQVLIALLLLFLLQQIDGNYIGPKLLAKNVSIDPVFVLIGVFLGGSLLGFIGMVLAVPVVAWIKVVFLRYLERRLEEMEQEK